MLCIYGQFEVYLRAWCELRTCSLGGQGVTLNDFFLLTMMPPDRFSVIRCKAVADPAGWRIGHGPRQGTCKMGAPCCCACHSLLLHAGEQVLRVQQNELQAVRAKGVELQAQVSRLSKVGACRTFRQIQSMSYLSICISMYRNNNPASGLTVLGLVHAGVSSLQAAAFGNAEEPS